MCFIVMYLLLSSNIPYKDSIVDLVNRKVPYKYKKKILVQEGSGFIQDVLTPVITRLGFLLWNDQLGLAVNKCSSTSKEKK